MLHAGVDLRDVQIAARHADPRTTMRYDRARKNLDRHPNYILAAYMASGTRPALKHQTRSCRRPCAGEGRRPASSGDLETWPPDPRDQLEWPSEATDGSSAK